MTDCEPEITVKWDVLFDQWFWVVRLGIRRRHGWSPQEEDANRQAQKALEEHLK